MLVAVNRVNIFAVGTIHKVYSLFKEYPLITDKMNTFMSKITAFYVQHILSPYRDMNKEMKRSLWLLILLLGGFTTLSLKPSLLNRVLGIKSI